MLRKFRKLNQFYAWVLSYFWLPCPICGEMFGGHEIPEKFICVKVASKLKVSCWRHQHA